MSRQTDDWKRFDPSREAKWTMPEPIAGRRWRRVGWGLACIAVAAVATASMIPGAAVEILRPGPLSDSHRFVSAGAQDFDQCASCHQTLTSAVRFDDFEGHRSSVSMTDRCVDCHHGTVKTSLAANPHGMSRSQLATLTEQQLSLFGADRSSKASDRDIECSACHREHRGQMELTSSLNNAQCQSCHVGTFVSFADHPPFRWKDRPQAAIRFDHARHADLHYREAETRGWVTSASMDCVTCHVGDGSSEPNRGAAYSTCAQCHDSSIRSALDTSVSWMGLPTVTEREADRLHGWPAFGITFEPEFTPLFPLEMTRDPQVSHPPVDRLRRAKNAKRELQSFSERGPSAWLDLGPKPGAAMVFDHLPPQFVQSAIERWFAVSGKSPDANISSAPPRSITDESAASLLMDASSEDELLPSSASIDVEDDVLLTIVPDDKDDDLLQTELEEEPFTSYDHSTGSDSTNVGRFDPFTRQRVGGWWVDDETLSVRYRGSGHADPVIRAMIDRMLETLIAMDAQHHRLEQAGSPMNQLRSIANTCLECHQVLVDGPRQTPRVLWEVVEDSPASLHHFSHAPHWATGQTAQCKTCHDLEPPDPTTDDLAWDAPCQSGFAAIEQQSCMKCHHASAAGERCTQCHRYHAPGFDQDGEGFPPRRDALAVMRDEEVHRR